MKSALLLCIASAFLCACATNPAPIIVKNNSYHELSAFSSAPAAPRLSPDVRRNASGSDFDNTLQEHYQAEDNMFHQRLQDYHRPIDLLHSSSSQRTRYFFSGNDDDESLEGKGAPSYQPASEQHRIFYIPVVVISVTEAEAQCDYVGSGDSVGHQGSPVPAWMDHRNVMAKQTAKQRYSAGGSSATLECKSGGYLLTYIGTHPGTGEQFSGTVLSKRPPASSKLNIPFSL